MTFSLRVPICLVAMACWIGAAGSPLRADDGIAPDRAMRMFRDPQTGAIGRPSAAALRADAGVSGAAPDAAPLVEEPVQGPAGGVKVNLRGTHRPAIVRNAGPPGVVVHECVEGAVAVHE